MEYPPNTRSIQSMAVYLIGGPPKCGKTTLAKTLSRELGIPWISADTLQNIIWAYTPESKHAPLFPHTYLRGEDNDETYNSHTAKEIVENYISQGKTTYAAIEMMAETYLIDGDDFIVEGYQVSPEIVDGIYNKFGTEHIKAVFLIKHDIQKFVEDIHKSTTPNDWILRKTNDAATFQKIAEMVDEYSVYFEEEAKKYNLPVFQMDTDFEGKIKEIILAFCKQT